MSSEAVASRFWTKLAGPKRSGWSRVWNAGLALIIAGIVASSTLVMRGEGHANAASTLPLFGFSYGSGAPLTVSADTAGQQMAAIQPGSVDRLGITWAALQPKCTMDTSPTVGVCLGQPGPIDWSGLDLRVDRLQSHGVRILGAFFTAPYFAWSVADCSGSRYYKCTSKPADVPMPPADNPTVNGYLTSFARQVVAHYELRNPGEFVGYEVWNEENVYGFWPTTSGPDSARYTRMLCAVHQGVQSANSSAPVVYGGLAYTPTAVNPTYTNTVSIPDFLNTSYANGAANCMTAMGFHSYPGGSPDAAGGPFLSVHDQVLAAEAAHRDSSRDNWITEFGYCTGNAVGNTFPCLASSQLDQANYEVCGYQMAAGMPDIKAFILHTLDDGVNATSLTDPSLYGVYNYPGSPKLAVTALSKLFGTLGSNVPAISDCSQAFNWQVWSGRSSPGRQEVRKVPIVSTKSSG